MSIGPLEFIIVMVACFLSIIPAMAIIVLVVWLIRRNSATRTITVPKDAIVTVHIQQPPPPPEITPDAPAP